MNSRITPGETALLMPYALPRAEGRLDGAQARAIVAEARRARAVAMADGLKALVHGLRAALTAIRMRRETIAQLRALSDRELADIGINRSGILAAAAPVAANDAVDARRAA